MGTSKRVSFCGHYVQVRRNVDGAFPPISDDTGCWVDLTCARHIYRFLGQYCTCHDASPPRSISFEQQLIEVDSCV